MAQTFDYQARNTQGKLISGQLEAVDANGAAEQLMRDGLMPVKLAPARKKQEATGGLRDLGRQLTTRIKLEDLSMLCRQMYSLMRAGVPLFQAVAGLGKSTTHPRLREALESVSTAMQGGKQLSVALADHPRIFNGLFISMVRVGENTGQLDQVFLQLSGHFEREVETRKRIKAALRYPTFVLLAVSAALVVMNIFVIPAFSSMFSRLGAELPWTTKVLMATSSFFVSYWPAMLGAVIAAIVGWSFALKTERWALVWDRLKIRMPLVGDIINRSLLARYGHTFSMMLRAGVPLVQALVLCAEAMDNRWMTQKIRGMREGIERGEGLLATSSASGLFTPLVLQMIAVGEQTGQVDELLQETANYYEREVEYDLKTLTARIEPIMIALVSGLVLILALGIFSPMWDLMGAMKG